MTGSREISAKLTLSISLLSPWTRTNARLVGELGSLGEEALAGRETQSKAPGIPDDMTLPVKSCLRAMPGRWEEVATNDHGALPLTYVYDTERREARAVRVRQRACT